MPGTAANNTVKKKCIPCNWLPLKLYSQSPLFHFIFLHLLKDNSFFHVKCQLHALVHSATA